MTRNRPTVSSLNALLNSDEIRRTEYEGRTFYSAVDIVKVLAESQHPQDYWADLMAREPRLDALCERLDEGGEVIDAVDLEGVLRLIQSIPSPRAEKLKAWLAQAGAQRLEEAENPELAAIRTRKLYEDKGYSRRWIDKRLRGISARHELTGEWYKRGASGTDEFRALTNELMAATFGMDVVGYRRYKRLEKPGDNLRDHMTDLELVLTMLSEAAAAALHRDRASQGPEALMRDVKDAGEVALRTRQEIEQRMSRPVVSARNNVRDGARVQNPERFGNTNPDVPAGASRRMKV